MQLYSTVPAPPILFETFHPGETGGGLNATQSSLAVAKAMISVVTTTHLRGVYFSKFGIESHAFG